MTNSQFIQDCCFYIDEVAMLLCYCVTVLLTVLHLFLMLVEQVVLFCLLVSA